MKELTQEEKATNYETLLHIMNVRNTIDKVIIALLSNTDDKIVSSVVSLLLQRAKDHDQSKLKDPELSTFVEFTPLLKNSTYGSPEYKEFLKGMQTALTHHYSENQHHPEHFAIYECNGCFKVFGKPVDHCDICGYSQFTIRSNFSKMNLIDLLEMLCDWKAATLRHADGDIQKSIVINKERFGISDEVTQILRNTADLLEE